MSERECRYVRATDRAAGRARRQVPDDRDHAPEGRTEPVSELRGHPVCQAAKCVVVLIKVDKKTRKYALAVVPGDTRVDLAALKAFYHGRYAGFADNETAERLSGSVSGTILPLTFTDELELVADPALFEHEEIFFNAARLDRSLALATEDYRRIAAPAVHAIAGEPGQAAS